jgi:hypothetical protein
MGKALVIAGVRNNVFVDGGVKLSTHPIASALLQLYKKG